MAKVSILRVNGPALRQLRQERGLSLRLLGRAIGRHPQAICRLENAKPPGKPCSVVFAHQLANALQTDVTAFTVQADGAMTARAPEDEQEPERPAA